MIFAYGSVPKDGGTFTLYKSLREKLKLYDWDMRCVTVGSQEHDVVNSAFIDDGCVSLAPRETDLKKQAIAFTNWCIETKAYVVMPVNSRAILSAVRHLPPEVCVVARCADTVENGYQKASYASYRSARIVTTTPRQTQDLINKYKIPPEKIVFIPHAIDVNLFRLGANHERGTEEHLNLAFLGRLEHLQKGVLYLPEFIKGIESLGIPYRLFIAGSGPDRSILEARMASAILDKRVVFTDTLNRDQVSSFLNTADVLLFPSHHEGFGFSLIESMAAGCVPIASRIEGVTDFIIRDHINGILCPIGNIDAFVQAILFLHENRDVLRSFSQAAAEEVRLRFSQERLSEQYSQLLNSVVAEALPIEGSLPWSEFEIPLPYQTSFLKRFIPRRVRRLKRRWLDFIQ